MPGYRNKRATERTLAALRRAGRLEEVDEAAMALARTLADALDRVDPEERPAQLASLARAQLASLRMLRGLGDDSDDGGLAEWLSGLSSAVGDAAES